MRVLALEPFYGGSHKAFLDGWSQRSRHRWTIMGLPASKWKWRMRHSAIHFSDLVNKQLKEGAGFDLLFCSDMLNLAEFLGIVDHRIRSLPSLIYFHENQLTYPVRFEKERDYQFGLTNLTSCLAADEVWFNSEFHRRSFLDAAPSFLRRMPDFRPLHTIDTIRRKSAIHYPGIENFTPPDDRKDEVIRILWSARWEHDKNPEDFFEAIKQLKEIDLPFRLSVIGQQFEETPEIFAWARDFFKDEIDHFGFLETHEEFISVLSNSDLVISTADHEFFGISVVEAIAAGAFPLLPDRLAYPEIMTAIDPEQSEQYFYDGSLKDLSNRLKSIVAEMRDRSLRNDRSERSRRVLKRFSWNSSVEIFDQALDSLCEKHT